MKAAENCTTIHKSFRSLRKLFRKPSMTVSWRTESLVSQAAGSCLLMILSRHDSVCSSTFLRLCRAGFMCVDQDQEKSRSFSRHESVSLISVQTPKASFIPAQANGLGSSSHLICLQANG